MSLLEDIKRIKAKTDHQRKRNPKTTKQADMITRNPTFASLNPTSSKILLQASIPKEFPNSQSNKSQTCSIASQAFDKITASSFCNAIKNYSEENSRSESEHQEDKHFFKGMVFIFGIRDIQLSKKRIEVLQKIVKRRGGQSIEMGNLENFMKINEPDGKKQCFVVSSLKRKIELIKKQFPSLKQFEKQFHFLDYEYISACEKMQQKINISPYLLEEKAENKQQEQKFHTQEESHVDSGPRKKIKRILSFPSKSEIQYPESQKQDSECSETLTITKLQDDEYLTQINEDPCELKRISSIFHEKKSDIQFYEKNILTRTQKKKREKFKPDKEKFMCQTGSSKSEYWINQFICDQLQKLQNIYENGNDLGRKLAYMKAVSAIRSYHKEIESQKDIAALRGIGSKITKKVRELLQTGKIQKLQKLQQGQQNISCCELSRVWGIGPSRAKQFYAKGIKTIQQLRNNQDLLNKNQRVGLKYLEEFQVRIKREKAKKIYEFVCKKLYEITENPALHHTEICGSYRRGKETCGDVDIIITRKDGKFEIALLLDLVCELEKCGFLTDHLSLPSRRKVDYNRPITYMGVCLLQNEQEDPTKNIHHRIDIKYYPLDQFAYAILYFTGSDMFNRSMRLYARRLGYTLSDRGMCMVDRSSKQKVKIGENVAAFSEQQIFTALGLEYKTPEQRNV